MKIVKVTPKPAVVNEMKIAQSDRAFTLLWQSMQSGVLPYKELDVPDGYFERNPSAHEAMMGHWEFHTDIETTTRSSRR